MEHTEAQYAAVLAALELARREIETLNASCEQYALQWSNQTLRANEFEKQRDAALEENVHLLECHAPAEYLRVVQERDAVFATLEEEIRMHSGTAVDLIRYSRMYADQTARANEFEKQRDETRAELARVREKTIDECLLKIQDHASHWGKDGRFLGGYDPITVVVSELYKAVAAMRGKNNG